MNKPHTDINAAKSAKTGQLYENAVFFCLQYKGEETMEI